MKQSKYNEIKSISRDDLVKNLCKRYSHEELAQVTIAMMIRSSSMSKQLEALLDKHKTTEVEEWSMISNVLMSDEDRIEYLYDTKGKIELANRIVLLEKRLKKIKEITEKK